MLGFLIIALILYFNGVYHVDFDNRYYAFLNDVNIKLSDWSVFKIPNIPEVPPLVSNPSDWADYLANGLSTFLNYIVSFLNFVIGLINTIIEVVKFIVALLVVLFEDLPAIFKPSENGGSSIPSSSSIPISSSI